MSLPTGGSVVDDVQTSLSASNHDDTSIELLRGMLRRIHPNIGLPV